MLLSVAGAGRGAGGGGGGGGRSGDGGEGGIERLPAVARRELGHGLKYVTLVH